MPELLHVDQLFNSESAVQNEPMVTELRMRGRLLANEIISRTIRLYAESTDFSDEELDVCATGVLTGIQQVWNGQTLVDYMKAVQTENDTPSDLTDEEKKFYEQQRAEYTGTVWSAAENALKPAESVVREQGSIVLSSFIRELVNKGYRVQDPTEINLVHKFSILIGGLKDHGNSVEDLILYYDQVQELSAPHSRMHQVDED